jgi:hypothetical protein
LRDNFLPGIDLDAVRPDFEAGAGHELEDKMRAPHSRMLGLTFLWLIQPAASAIIAIVCESCVTFSLSLSFHGLSRPLLSLSLFVRRS